VSISQGNAIPSEPQPSKKLLKIKAILSTDPGLCAVIKSNQACGKPSNVLFRTVSDKQVGICREHWEAVCRILDEEEGEVEEEAVI